MSKLETKTSEEIYKIVGIDLAGVDNRPTGFATLNGVSVKTKVLFHDEEIIGEIFNLMVGTIESNGLISIDAPLNRPSKGKSRICEKALRRLGIRVFPCMFAGMAKLTERGIKLATKLRGYHYEVIESYPGSAQDILGIPRKGKNQKLLQDALIKYGIKGDVTKPNITNHELDAITSAIVGKLYLQGETVALGTYKEGFMIVPRFPTLDNYTQRRKKE